VKWGLTRCKTVRFALCCAAKEVPANEMNAAATPDILIIEDDPIMREALADWLQAVGYGVRKAADGGAGLAAVKVAAPSLVVTDIYMPGQSGVAVIAELKQGYPDIPIIAISGLFNSGHGMDADAALALGAARALAKPFKRRDLLRAVADLLGAPNK
jgi:CheY-like chemotaxis protein